MCIPGKFLFFFFWMFIMIRTNAVTPTLSCTFYAIFQAKQSTDGTESCYHEIVNQQRTETSEKGGNRDVKILSHKKGKFRNTYFRAPSRNKKIFA